MSATCGRILVVDDEANIRAALAKLISKLGHTVKTAASADEALHFMKHGRIHLVITDLRMPGQDGLQLLRQLRTTDPQTDVILMTAYGTVEFAVEAMKAGAYDYIEKPINHEPCAAGYAGWAWKAAWNRTPVKPGAGRIAGFLQLAWPTLSRRAS